MKVMNVSARELRDVTLIDVKNSLAKVRPSVAVDTLKAYEDLEMCRGNALYFRLPSVIGYFFFYVGVNLQYILKRESPTIFFDFFL